jgi:hypothetical protein
MFELPVRTRVVGAAPSEPKLDDVLLSLFDDTLTVRELIAMTIEEQVRDLTMTRNLDSADARRILDRQYLTAEDVDRQAATGVIAFPAHKQDRPLEIDTQAEIERAERGFERGTYAVFVDGRQMERLDEEVTLHATSRATFVRMTPLVGG